MLCSRQACSRYARSCLVRSGLFWFGPLCFTLDWSALVFLVTVVCSSTASFGLSLSVLFAVLALDWSSNMIAVSNAVAFLNIVGRGNSLWFGLPCFSFYEVWSDCSVLVSSV